jgi:hypothetical protein
MPESSDVSVATDIEKDLIFLAVFGIEVTQFSQTFPNIPRIPSAEMFVKPSSNANKLESPFAW